MKIFQSLIKIYPNEYIINSNLGTLYELNGFNDSALKYIEKSILINPNSHNKSEWLHENILKTKLQSNINLRNIKFTDSLSLDKNGTYSEKVGQVFHQLTERLQFSKVGDLYVAKIFEELGDFYYKQYSIKYGLLYYTIAYEYSDHKWSDLLEKINNAKIACKKAEINSNNRKIRKYGMQPFDTEIEQQRRAVSTFKPFIVKEIEMIDYENL